MLKIITHYGPQVQLFLFAGIFFLAWNIERIAGTFFIKAKWKHTLLNAPFIITNFPGLMLMGFAFAFTIHWSGLHHIGFLNKLPFEKSVLFKFAVSFLFLDFGEYVYHVLMHKIKKFWLFHVVHHSDHVVDVSTTLREHPGESIIRLSFTLFWVFLSGTAFWMLMARQIIQAGTTLFAHMNYRFSQKTDSLLSLILITPNLHQVHHHYKQPYTDCNYGDVLSIWDRMFGTLKEMPAADIKFGIDTYMEEAKLNSFRTLIELPFSSFKSLLNKKRKSFKSKRCNQIIDFETHTLEHTTIEQDVSTIVECE